MIVNINERLGVAEIIQAELFLYKIEVYEYFWCEVFWLERM